MHFHGQGRQEVGGHDVVSTHVQFRDGLGPNAAEEAADAELRDGIAGVIGQVDVSSHARDEDKRLSASRGGSR